MRLQTYRLMLGVLLMGLSLSGCLSSGGQRSLPTEAALPGGFSITESEGVGFRVRSNFEDANDAILEGRLDEGIELLEEVTADAPDFAAGHINLGLAHQRNGDLEKAEASLLRAIEANPRHPVAHNELGIVYRQTGRFEKARASYEAALDLQPEFHFARKNLAVLCDLYLSNLPCALEHYRLYLESDPQNESVEIWIADLEGRVGKKEN